MNLKIFDEKDFPAYLPRLNALYDDLFSGGKGFRAKMIAMVAHHLALPEKTVHLLSQTIEFIHNASLLHDDLIDRSHLRRGKPAAWTKYTPEYAVLAGDYLLARVMVNLSNFGNIKLVQLTSQTISDLLEGEWIQDSLVRDFNVTVEQLDRVHNFKTASLFKWCLRAPFVASENYNDKIHGLLEELGSILGLLFQRSDDLLDYDIRNFEGKTILGDLKSGYLNSFSAFLIEQINLGQKEMMLKSQSVDELKLAIGNEYFERRLQEFDQKNEKLIQLYGHHLEQLKKLLSQDSQKLTEDLKPLTQILYWRQKPK